MCDLSSLVLLQQQIAFDRVNDDYCDCSDSSDEPGTSACPDSRYNIRGRTSAFILLDSRTSKVKSLLVRQKVY